MNRFELDASQYIFNHSKCIIEGAISADRCVLLEAVLDENKFYRTGINYWAVDELHHYLGVCTVSIWNIPLLREPERTELQKKTSLYCTAYFLISPTQNCDLRLSPRELNEAVKNAGRRVELICEALWKRDELVKAGADFRRLLEKHDISNYLL